MRAGVLLLAAAVALCEAVPFPDLNGTFNIPEDPSEVPHDVIHNVPHSGLCALMMSKLDEFMESLGLGMDILEEEGFHVMCDEDGNFEPKQCHEVAPGETWCMCVDVMTGKGRPNTLSKGDDLMCDENGKIEKPCCPPHWTRFSEHGHDMCYMFINSNKTWVEAESYCRFEHGRLASIHCQETNHFLQVLTRGETYEFPETWVGGTNAVQTCFWMWSDGSDFAFEDWSHEDSKNRNDSCLSINHGCAPNQYKWSSSSCNRTLPFVCAKPLECESHY